MRRLLLAALLLSGCSASSFIPGNDGESVAKWTDPETGCVYLVYHRGMANAAVGSLSIRFRTDGKPDCPGSGSAS